MTFLLLCHKSSFSLLLHQNNKTRCSKIPSAWLRKGRALDNQATTGDLPTCWKHCLCKTLQSCYSEWQLVGQQPLNRSSKEDHNTRDNSSRGCFHAGSLTGLILTVGLLLQSQGAHRFQYSTTLNCKQQQQRKKAPQPQGRHQKINLMYI